MGSQAAEICLQIICSVVKSIKSNILHASQEMVSNQLSNEYYTCKSELTEKNLVIEQSNEVLYFIFLSNCDSDKKLVKDFYSIIGPKPPEPNKDLNGIFVKRLYYLERESICTLMQVKWPLKEV